MSPISQALAEAGVSSRAFLAKLPRPKQRIIQGGFKMHSHAVPLWQWCDQNPGQGQRAAESRKMSHSPQCNSDWIICYESLEFVPPLSVANPGRETLNIPHLMRISGVMGILNGDSF